MSSRPAVGPLGIATILASLAFLAAGIAWPQAAEAWLRLLLATLATGFVAGRAYEALRPVSKRQDLYSPFDGHTITASPPTAPHALRDLTRQLDTADDERRARRTEIPRSVRWTVIDEASRRLAEHHGLSLGEPGHRANIRSLVSAPTWSLIAPSDPGPHPAPRPAAHDPRVPLSQLGRILDDLERL